MINYLFTKFQEDGDLFALLADRYFVVGSLGEDSDPKPDTPYCVWREQASRTYKEVEDQSDATERTFYFYIYDKKGDFTKISAALRAMKRVIKEISPFTDNEGVRCSGATWDGESNTFSDEEFDTSGKYGIGRFTVSQ